MGTKNIPVFALPRMHQYLSEHGPWKQLVELRNIQLIPLEADVPIQIADWFEVTSIKVPHRDEFSETAGFIVKGNVKSFFIYPTSINGRNGIVRLKNILAKRITPS